MAATLTNLPSNERNEFWSHLQLHIASISGFVIPKDHTRHRKALAEIHQYLQELQAWHIEHLQEVQGWQRAYMNMAVLVTPPPGMTRTAISAFFLTVASAITEISLSEQVKFWNYLKLNVESIDSIILKLQANDQQALVEIHQYLQNLQIWHMQELNAMSEEESQEGLIRRRVREQLMDILDSFD